LIFGAQATHRRGGRTKPFAASLWLTISIVEPRKGGWKQGLDQRPFFIR
jgi:hypothetical protein